MSTIRVNTITDQAGTGGPAFSNGLSSNNAVTISSTLAAGNTAITGTITATGDITAFFSDDRLKTRIAVIDNALEKVSLIQGFYYEANQTAKDLGYTDIGIQIGVSAQEVQKVLPEIVVSAPISDKYLTVKYEKLTPLIIEAIKELKTRIEDIEKVIYTDYK